MTLASSPASAPSAPDQETRIGTLSDQIECVYLIGNETNTLVKIGRSVDVQGRLAGLQAGSPVPLTLLWQTLGGAELETALHRWFESCRAHGEWFDFPAGDAVACVVQALPEVAAEIQRAQREQLAQLAQQAKAAADAAAPRDRVTQVEWEAMIRQAIADHPGIDLNPSPLAAVLGLDTKTRSSGNFKRAVAAVRVGSAPEDEPTS